MSQDLISTKEAAELLNRSHRTLESWRRRPTKMQPFPYFFDGFRIWYDRATIEAFKEKSLVQVG